MFVILSIRDIVTLIHNHRSSTQGAYTMKKFLPKIALCITLAVWMVFTAAADSPNITQYIADDGSTHTIYWLEGITPPAMPNQTTPASPGAGTFKRISESGNIIQDPSSSTGKFDYFVSEYMPGNGWYDTNKEYGSKYGRDDSQFCFAVSSANLITWWLDQNADNVQKYLATDPMPETLEGLANPKDLQKYLVPVRDQLPQNNPVYDMYRDVFFAGHGGYPDHPSDLFLNGYAPSLNQYLAHRPSDFRPDPHGGFFYPVFGKQILTSRIGNDRYENLDREIKAYILNGNGITFTFNAGNYNHAITLWGAEYDDRDHLVALFITNSDDIDNPFYENGQAKQESMVRYSVHQDTSGRARATTLKNPGPNEGVLVLTPFTLSLGDKEWESFFINGSPDDTVPQQPENPDNQHTHNFQYKQDRFKIIQTCKGCDLYNWVELTRSSMPPYVYDGNAKTPYTFVSSSENIGFTPDLTYKNNIDAGISTVSMSYGGSTVEVTFLIDKANQEKPEPVRLKEKTANSITLYGDVGQEYSINGTDWTQASGETITFRNLTENTAYSLYARKAESKNYNASLPSEPVIITTEKGTAQGEEFTIHFVTGGADNAIPPQSTKNQKLENGLPVPEPLVGQTFIGWFIAPVGGSPVTVDTIYTGNTTLYARWQLNSYTISFDTDGGTHIPAITQSYGSDIALPAVPKKDGHTFLRWDPAPPKTMPDSNITLKAVWGKQDIKADKLTTVPPTLMDTPYHTVELIQAQLQKAADSLLPADSTGVTLFFDITCYIDDPVHGGRPATQDEIQAGSKWTVRIPYPQGTSSTTHDFIAAHMITIAMDGKRPGDIETPTVIEKDDHLEITFTGLSPVVLQYYTAPTPSNPEGTSPETSVPEDTVPETTTPESTVPETTAPDGTNPDSTIPATGDTAYPITSLVVAVISCAAAMALIKKKSR